MYISGVGVQPATLREKLQINLAASNRHSVLAPGQAVLAIFV